jgi:hypothetical protein
VRGEKTASPFSPRTFPLASQRLYERKASFKDSQLVIWLLAVTFLGLPTRSSGPRPQLFGKSLFSSQFSHTPALSSQTTKGVWYQELWLCCHPNKHRNVIYNMKYAKNREHKEGPARGA